MTFTKLNRQLNVRLDDELFETLARVVRLRRTTQSQYIRDALLSYLKLKNITIESDETHEANAS
jgi:predicted transcriptional regulator